MTTAVMSDMDSAVDFVINLMIQNRNDRPRYWRCIRQDRVVKLLPHGWKGDKEQFMERFLQDDRIEHGLMGRGGEKLVSGVGIRDDVFYKTEE